MYELKCKQCGGSLAHNTEGFCETCLKADCVIYKEVVGGHIFFFEEQGLSSALWQWTSDVNKATLVKRSRFTDIRMRMPQADSAVVRICAIDIARDLMVNKALEAEQLAETHVIYRLNAGGSRAYYQFKEGRDPVRNWTPLIYEATQLTPATLQMIMAQQARDVVRSFSALFDEEVRMQLEDAPKKKDRHIYLRMGGETETLNTTWLIYHEGYGDTSWSQDKTRALAYTYEDAVRVCNGLVDYGWDVDIAPPKNELNIEETTDLEWKVYVTGFNGKYKTIFKVDNQDITVAEADQLADEAEEHCTFIKSCFLQMLKKLGVHVPESM